MSGESLNQQADRYRISPATIANHLTTCVRLGLPVHRRALGLSTELAAQVWAIVEGNHRGIFSSL
jgi:hypothetical protein